MTTGYPGVGVSARTPVVPIVALAASAGGIQALTCVLGALPAGLAAPVLVVLHLHPGIISHLPEILQRSCALPVDSAVHHAWPAPGRVYVAPPDHHLVVDDQGRLELQDQDPVHFLRPCADLLFESMARRCGTEALAVVLSGSGRDGAAGATALRVAGGEVLVQDPAEADFAGMPRAALEGGLPIEALPIDLLGARVVDWCDRHVAVST